jgi:four helix bundle protein
MEMKRNTNWNLEDRLIEFSISVVDVLNNTKNSMLGFHLKKQAIRSSTSPALNYAEAQFAESEKDFIHKVKIILKELCETRVCLKMILRTRIYSGEIDLEQVIQENNELIAIFITSINTAKNKMAKNISSK